MAQSRRACPEPAEGTPAMLVLTDALQSFPATNYRPNKKSQALGMTKGRAKLSWRAVAGQRSFSSPWVGRRPMSTPVEMTSLFESEVCFQASLSPLYLESN